MERDGAPARLAASPTRSARVEPFDATTLEAALGARRRAAGGEAARRLPADPGRDHRHDGLARDLRVARRARPRARARADRGGAVARRSTPATRLGAKQARLALPIYGWDRGGPRRTDANLCERMTRSHKDEPTPERRGRVRGGRRLADAFDEVSPLPALAEARRRLLGLCERQAASSASSPRRSSPTPRWRSRSCAPPTTATAPPGGPGASARRSRR